jgi:hypothetical protein
LVSEKQYFVTSILRTYKVFQKKKNLLSNSIKVVVQPGLGNNGRNFGRNLNHQTSYIYASVGRQQAGGRAIGWWAGGLSDTSKAR